jgi:hypothetical protein
MSNALTIASQDDGNTIPINITDPTLTGPPVEMQQPVPTNGLVPTGAKVILPVPSLKTSADPMFLIRLNPMMILFSDWPTNADDCEKVFLFPIQFPWTSAAKSPAIKMLWEPAYNEHVYNMMTHRFMTGQIDVVLRISSNVGVTGSVLVTEIQDAVRSFDCYHRGALANTVRYQGYRSLPGTDLNASNSRGQAMSLYPYAHVHNSFALNDLSLTRHFELSTSYSFGQNLFDHHQYFTELRKYFAIFKASGTKNLNWNYSFAHLFKENLLMVSQQTDITSEPGQITFELLADFSKIQYHQKLVDGLLFNPELEVFDTDIKDITQYYHLASSAKAFEEEKKAARNGTKPSLDIAALKITQDE